MVYKERRSSVQQGEQLGPLLVVLPWAWGEGTNPGGEVSVCEANIEGMNC